MLSMASNTSRDHSWSEDSCDTSFLAQRLMIFSYVANVTTGSGKSLSNICNMGADIHGLGSVGWVGGGEGYMTVMKQRGGYL